MNEEMATQKASGEKYDKEKRKEKKNTYTQILPVLDLHQICIISNEGACCNMLDIIYLDNYNKRVFECKKICILEYITSNTYSDNYKYLKCIFMTGMWMKIMDLFWAQHVFLLIHSIKRQFSLELYLL